MKAMTRPCRLSPRSLLHTSSMCLNKPDPSTSLSKPSAQQQQELDFFKAADILFSEEDPKRKKKFGWDFHLWQAFVACLPSVAVYLTAQYARWDIRRMEAEREREDAEKRIIEEKKQEEESRKLPGFRTLHERLDKLEEKICEIESKTAPSAPTLQEDKLEKAEKVETKVKEGNADAHTQRESDAKELENAIQNTPMKKEKPKEGNEESGKEFKDKSSDGNSEKQVSKAEPDEKGEIKTHAGSSNK